MVAGHLQEKNGIYYVVLTYKTYLNASKCIQEKSVCDYETRACHRFDT